MGKREMKPMPIKYLILEVFSILVFIGLYLVVFSVPENRLEAKITNKADFAVAKVNQFSFSNGGQVVVAEDVAQKNGILQVYAEIPIINRYMRTKEIKFIVGDEPSMFAAEEWSNSGAFTLEDGVVTRPGVGEDMGLSGKVLYYLIWMEGFIIAMTLIRNDIVKTRREREANPVKNY